MCKPRQPASQEGVLNTNVGGVFFVPVAGEPWEPGSDWATREVTIFENFVFARKK